MTTSARTVETKAADAVAQLLTFIGDTDNMPYWVTQFEDSFPSPIRRTDVTILDQEPPVVAVHFEDGSVLHLTVTQIKEPNQ